MEERVMTGRRILIMLVGILVLFPAIAHSATVPVVLKLQPATNLSLITNLLGGTVRMSEGSLIGPLAR